MTVYKFAFGDVSACFRSRWQAPVLALAGGFALMHGVVMALRIRKAVAMSRSIEPLQAKLPNATVRLLLVGDSTAVGTGASTADTSIAGLIARHHPDVRIVNRARVGAKFADIVRQLESLERFDIILILGGGNDVIRLTSNAALQTSVDKALQLASDRANTVVLMPAGNIGNTPFFPQPLSWLMRRRSRKLHAIAKSAAASAKAIYVNGYKEKHEDPFVREAGRLNAADGLHPSDDGYQLWFGALQEQAALSQRLTAVVEQ